MRSTFDIGANVPAFLGKLWKLVDDPKTDHLISWSPGGKMFTIHHQADFARDLLPLYYKHNNMASFIRQLNMYGFHKKSSVDNGGLKYEKDDIEFSHPCFLQGHAYLLDHIKRKITIPKAGGATSTGGEDKVVLKPEIMTKVLTDVKHMKGRQESLDARFSVMKHENAALWREVALLRQKHLKQQQIVNNLIQFLMSVVQSSRNGPLKTGVKRRYQLMINNAAHNSAEAEGGSDEAAQGSQSASKSPRLDTDTDIDIDDSDYDDENGPTIHELAEQEHALEVAAAEMDEDYQEDLPESVVMQPSEAGSPAFNIVGEELEIDPAFLEASPITIEVPPMQEEASRSEQPSPSSTKAMRRTAKASPRKRFHKPRNPSTPFSVVTQASPTLPSDIFDSDDTTISQDESSVSLSDVNQQAAMSALQSVASTYYEGSQNDKANNISNLATGSYNTNVNLSPASEAGKDKPAKKVENKKSDLARSIKQEILNPEEEQSDWTLATVPKAKDRPPLNRFHSVEDVDDHLDTMQTDIDSLREMLRGDSYSLDPNTLFGLFGADDPFYSLSMNPTDLTTDKNKDLADDPASQVISYVPPTSLLDFEDFQLDNEGDGEEGGAWTEAQPVSSTGDSSELNTPQISLGPPDFTARGASHK